MYWWNYQLVVYLDQSIKIEMKNKGFTLIELVFVFTIIGIITVVSFAAYNGFNKSQTLSTAVNDVIALFQAARSKAVSQVKPTACTNKTLQGYQVTLSIAASTYQLEVVCGGTTTMLEKKTLPSGVTFAASSPTQIRFNVSTGTVASTATVTINGNSTSKQIRIDPSGNVATQ